MRPLLFCFVMLSRLLAHREVVVELPMHEAPVHGIYLAKPKPCVTDYEEAVYQLLHRDLLFVDKDRLLDTNDLMQSYAHHADPHVGLQASWWRSFGTRFVIIPKWERDTLSVQIFDVATASLKSMTPIPVTRNLTKDSHLLHKLSDAITHVIFGKEGITSKRILYAVQPKKVTEREGEWHSEIWEMDYEGLNARPLTQENSFSITPAFIPNKKNPENYAFMYVTYKQGPPRVYISSRNRLKGVPLIPLRGNQLLPTLSRTQDKIAFISDASGRADLFVQPYNPDKGVEGKPVQLYSCAGSVQASPTFHPDGSKLAFVSDKSGPPRIYLIEASLTKKPAEPKLLIRNQHDSSSPSWSPDGKKLAFSSKTNGVRQIWIYDFDEEREKQLTHGDENKENPSWAPDSEHLVYNSTTPTHDIYRISIHDPTPVRLTHGDGIHHYPVFEQ